MFDPTIFENLKVVLEGNIYEHDLSGDISIIDRKDLINLATMSRSYSISFTHINEKDFEATIMLEADANDLYGEILEHEAQIGCRLVLTIEGPIKDPVRQPKQMLQRLETLWNNRPIFQAEIIQDVLVPDSHFVKISLSFNRKINEDHITDLPEVLLLLLESLDIIGKIHATT